MTIDEAKQLLYKAERKEHREAMQNPEPIINTIGEVPIMERAEYVPEHLFNGA